MSSNKNQIEEAEEPLLWDLEETKSSKNRNHIYISVFVIFVVLAISTPFLVHYFGKTGEPVAAENLTMQAGSLGEEASAEKSVSQYNGVCSGTDVYAAICGFIQPPFVAQNINNIPYSYVWSPGEKNTEGGDNGGRASFAFYCNTPGDVTFNIYYSASDARSDSFYVAVDQGVKQVWDLTPTGNNNYEWTSTSMFAASNPNHFKNIKAGHHQLHISEREDAAKFRKVQIDSGDKDRADCHFEEPTSLVTVRKEDCSSFRQCQEGAAGCHRDEDCAGNLRCWNRHYGEHTPQYDTSQIGGLDLCVDISKTGSYEEWTQWGACSKTCGLDSIQQRTRHCNGVLCDGAGSETLHCQVPSCCNTAVWQNTQEVCNTNALTCAAVVNIEQYGTCHNFCIGQNQNLDCKATYKEKEGTSCEILSAANCKTDFNIPAEETENAAATATKPDNSAIICECKDAKTGVNGIFIGLAFFLTVLLM